MKLNFVKNLWGKWKQEPVQGILVFCLYAFLFLFSFQTILIFQKTQNGTVGIFGFEILLWLMAIAYFFVRRKQKKESQKKYSFFQKILVLFFLICFVSTLFAPEKLLAVFQIFRILEALGLYFFLTHIQYNKSVAFASLFAGSVVQSLLGIFQFVTQSTVSFKWLGLVEHPVFETGSSVVQSIEAGRVLRAYGAFPHPNVFGGYLVVCIVFTTILYLKYFQKFQNIQNSKIFSKQFFQSFFLTKNVLLLSTLSLQIIALFFTFSRSAWLSAALWFTGIFFFFFKQKKKRIFFLYFLLALQVFVLSATHISLLKTRVQATSYHETRSVEERKNLSITAWELFKTHPLFGVGIGNYVPAVGAQNPFSSSASFEPVHMVPLLILTEFGIFGVILIAFLVVLFLKQQKLKHENYFFLFVLSPLLLFDHYLYTLPFGILLFATYFGLLTKNSFSTPAFFCVGSGEFSSIDTEGQK